MHKSGLAILLVAGLAAPMAQGATLACSFSQECLEGEDCETTDYDLDVLRDAAAETATVQDPSGAYAARALGAAWAWHSDFGVSLLSTTSEGRARYTIHMPADDLSILYLGTCTEIP